MRSEHGALLTSREIIWRHARDYRWMRTPNYNGDLWIDRFTRDGEPPLLVRYTQTGRVLSVLWGGLPIAQRNRDGVLDALELWASGSSVVSGSGETGEQR